MEKAYFNWSSGKDSALALYHAVQSGEFDVRTLFSVVKEQEAKIAMHETSTTLLQKQAEAIGIPLTLFFMGNGDSQSHYRARMQETIAQFKRQGITTALFGDLYFEALRETRERNCAKEGIKAAFPLWNCTPEEIMSEWIRLGFRAIVTCVDGNVLDESFVGRIIDESFLKDLPPQADICGENGEYHSFVFDGPLFQHPVSFQKGQKYYVDYSEAEGSEQMHRYWYLDLKE